MKEADVELAWNWRGYGISIRVLRKGGQQQGRTCREGKYSGGNLGTRLPRQVASRASMAFGSRFVGPIS